VKYRKGHYIIAFGEAWVCTPKAFKEIQAILLSIYGPKEEKVIN